MRTIVYLRDVGTDDDPCWVVCAKGDPGAVAFIRETDADDQANEARADGWEAGYAAAQETD